MFNSSPNFASTRSPFMEFCLNHLSPLEERCCPSPCTENKHMTPRTLWTSPKSPCWKKFTSPIPRFEINQTRIRFKPEVLDPPPAIIKPVLPQKRKMDKKISCNCSKSRCLKLYCDCFAAGHTCGEHCNCTGCCNTEDHKDERLESMNQILDRNPHAFKPKFSSENTKEKHLTGCNCKRSNCLKKYCECFQRGVKCGEICKCTGCKNNDHCH